MIGLAVLRSGGEVAPCSITEMMVLDSQLYGYMQRYDFLGCHANFRSVSMSALAALQRPVAIVTTNRKPVSWFYSAAVRCWERRNRRLTKDEQILKEAIDDALEDRYDFTSFRKSFLSNHGLSVTSSAEDVRRIANVYTYVFDHETLEEDVNHALVDMGYPKSYPTVRRVGVYKKDWAENYRVDEIRKLLNVEEMLYQALKKVRDLKDEKLQNTIRRDGSLIMMQFSSVGRNNETREDVLKRLGQT